MENPKDRMDVLKMIEEGRISAAEGARLLGSSGQPVNGVVAYRGVRQVGPGAGAGVI